LSTPTAQQLDDAAGVATVNAPQPPLQDRVRASLHHLPLDRRIAEGETIIGDREMEARAWQLTRPRTLGQLEDGLQRVGRDSYATRSERNAAQTACHEEVRVARGELQRLAERLQDPRPVRAQGAARVSLLLSDHNGPLYVSQSRHTLWRIVREAIDALA
jgi:hypothetical protein